MLTGYFSCFWGIFGVWLFHSPLLNPYVLNASHSKLLLYFAINTSTIKYIKSFVICLVNISLRFGASKTYRFCRSRSLRVIRLVAERLKKAKPSPLKVRAPRVQRSEARITWSIHGFMNRVLWRALITSTDLFLRIVYWLCYTLTKSSAILRSSIW